jgi:tetrahydromethanopterin S-methyltransferase subunit D
MCDQVLFSNAKCITYRIVGAVAYFNPPSFQRADGTLIGSLVEGLCDQSELDLECAR